MKMKRANIITALFVTALALAAPATAQDQRSSMADAVLDAIRKAVPGGFPDLLVMGKRGRDAEATVLKARQALRDAEASLAYAREQNNPQAATISGRAIQIARRALRKAKQDIARISGLTLAVDRAIETISRRIAEEADAALAVNPGFHRDPVWETRLSGILADLRKTSLKPGAKLRVRILDDNNPMGMAKSSPTTVYLLRGYLAANPSDKELAFVLGHEMAHADLRHSALWMIRARYDEETDWMSSLASEGPNNPQIEFLIRDAAVRVRRADYERHQEFIADMVGTHTALESGADPSGLKAMLARMSRYRAASAGNYPTSAEQKRAQQLSDHPTPDERRRKLKSLFGDRVRF